MQLKDYQLDDTDVSTDISDLNCEEQHSLSSESFKAEKNQSMSNSTSNGSAVCELPDENRKSNILVDPTKHKGFPPRIIQEMSMESPQAPLWPTHRRQCSTPETGIISDPNLFFNIQPEIRVEVDESENIPRAKREKEGSESSSIDYENIKKIADELGSTQRKLESFLKFSERSRMSEIKPITDKIACCMKEVYNLLGSVVQNVNLDSSIKDKEEFHSSPVNGKQLNQEPNSGFSNQVDVSNDQLKMRNQVKTFCEKYDCTLAFTVDEKKDQLVSVSIEQMNRIPDYIRVEVVSGSSGSLADHSSLSDSHSVNSLRKLPFQLPGRHSIPESSSTSSGSSVQQSSLRHSHQFLAPDKLPKRPKNCICKCFCSLLKSSPVNQSVSATPDLLMSSIENSKIETNNSKEIPQNTEEFLKGISHTSSEKVLSVDIPELAKKDEMLKTSNMSEISKSFEEPKFTETIKEEVAKNDSVSKKESTDLLVFGRWINKYYPGKIEGVTLEDWHDSDKPLKVLFFDGLPKLLANVFIIPATMLPTNMDIMCPVGDDLYAEGTLVATEKVIDENFQESLKFIISVNDIVVSVPFEKVWFNETTKKQLGITPRKPKVAQLEMTCSGLSRKRQLPSINEQNITLQKDSTSSASEKSAKKLKASGSSVKNTTEEVKSEPQSSKTLKRMKSSSDEGSIKSKKYIKKLEFEPKPSTSSANLLKDSNNSSETDSSDFHKEDYIEVSDLDHEYYQINYRKSLEFGKIKSFSKVSSLVQEKDDTLGPIRNSNIFKGYNFVLTHSHNDGLHSKLVTKKRVESYKETLSSTENETDEMNEETSDLEYQLRNCPDFDYVRLKMQIKAGGGIIYDSVAEINKAEYAHTITISDYPCQTPNYLLSIALGIPVYRHDLIISSCKEDTPVSKMIRFGYLMPTGQSLENGAMVERANVKTKKPFRGFTCAINISSSPKFWKTLLKAMGAIVLSVNGDLTGCRSSISFILADKYISRQTFAIAIKENIPLVTKTWVIQSLIHGEQQLYNTSPEFIVTPD